MTEPTFAVNGKLATLADMAGMYCELMLIYPRAAITGHMVCEDADGIITVMQLVCTGEELDGVREAVFTEGLTGTEQPFARMLFFCEAWVAARTSADEPVPGSLATTPGRKEAVVFDGRDKEGNSVQGLRLIDRSGELGELGEMHWMPAEKRHYVPSTSDTGER